MNSLRRALPDVLRPSTAGTAERSGYIQRPSRPTPASAGNGRIGRRQAVTLAALGVSMLAGLVLALSAAAGSLFLVPSAHSELPGWLAGPLPDLGSSLPKGVEVGLIAVMGMAWVAVLVSRASLVRATVATIVVLHVLMLLAPPLLSTDVFGYLAFGRLGVVHDLNPYSHAVESIPDDPVNTYLSSIWPTDLKSPYGPLFLLLTYVLAPLGVPAGLWGAKLAATAAALGCLTLVAACARRLRLDPVRAAAFVGLNPLWLTWVLGGAHNDLPMMLAAMGGVLLLLASRERASGALLAVAIAVKATAGLMAAFILAGARRAGRVLVGGILAGASLLGLFVAVFGLDVFLYPATLAEQGSHVSRYNVPRKLVELVGAPEVTTEVKLVANGAFIAVTVWLLVAVRRGADWITAAGWSTIAFLLTTTSLHTWYVAALLPLAALSRSLRLQVATAVMTVVLMVVQLIPPA